MTNVTIPYALQIANKGVTAAVNDNKAIEEGVNTANGHLTYEAVARDLDYSYTPVLEALKEIAHA